MKGKRNQGFSTIDFFSVVSSVTALAIISGPLIRRGLESENILQAEKQMKEIVTEISNKGSDLHERSLASSSREGEKVDDLDPWGQSFQKMVIRNSYGQATHVLIWSSGPNGRPDTPNLNPQDKDGVIAVVFDGDDIGILRTLE